MAAPAGDSGTEVDDLLGCDTGVARRRHRDHHRAAGRRLDPWAGPLLTLGHDAALDDHPDLVVVLRHEVGLAREEHPVARVDLVAEAPSELDGVARLPLGRRPPGAQGDLHDLLCRLKVDVEEDRAHRQRPHVVDANLEVDVLGRAPDIARVKINHVLLDLDARVRVLGLAGRLREVDLALDVGVARFQPGGGLNTSAAFFMAIDVCHSRSGGSVAWNVVPSHCSSPFAFG